MDCPFPTNSSFQNYFQVEQENRPFLFQKKPFHSHFKKIKINAKKNYKKITKRVNSRFQS